MSELYDRRDVIYLLSLSEGAEVSEREMESERYVSTGRERQRVIDSKDRPRGIDRK